MGAAELLGVAPETPNASRAITREEAADRRRHALVHNYWRTLKGDRPLPSIWDLDPFQIADAGPNSVMLDLSKDRENPEILVGEALRYDAASPNDSASKADSQALIGCLLKNYAAVLGKSAPVAFEDDCVVEGGRTLHCFGTLFPFSSTGHSVDYIFGLLSWTESEPEALAVADEAPIPLPVDDLPLAGLTAADAPVPAPAQLHAVEVPEPVVEEPVVDLQAIEEIVEEVAGPEAEAAELPVIEEVSDEELPIVEVAPAIEEVLLEEAVADVAEPVEAEVPTVLEEDNVEAVAQPGYDESADGTRPEGPAQFMAFGKAMFAVVKRLAVPDNVVSFQSFAGAQASRADPREPVPAADLPEAADLTPIEEPFAEAPIVEEIAAEPFIEDEPVAEEPAPIDAFEIEAPVAADDEPVIAVEEPVEAALEIAREDPVDLSDEPVTAGAVFLDMLSPAAVQVEKKLDIVGTAKPVFITPEDEVAKEPALETAPVEQDEDLLPDGPVTQGAVFLDMVPPAETVEETMEIDVSAPEEVIAPDPEPEPEPKPVVVQIPETVSFDALRQRAEPLELVEPAAEPEEVSEPVLAVAGDDGLLRQLSVARAIAAAAPDASYHSRTTLYMALGHAYTLALMAEGSPVAYNRMLEEAGIQARGQAPMIPVVELVFGAEYDRKRRQEYAALLSLAQRANVEPANLASHLEFLEAALAIVTPL